jgi:hypothetical protein
MVCAGAAGVDFIDESLIRGFGDHGSEDAFGHR